MEKGVANIAVGEIITALSKRGSTPPLGGWGVNKNRLTGRFFNSMIFG
jgi:hypothetical protein